MRQWQAKPENFTLSEEMWFKLHNRIDQEDGIDFLTGVGTRSERPNDVINVLSSSRPVPGELILELPADRRSNTKKV